MYPTSSTTPCDDARGLLLGTRCLLASILWWGLSAHLSHHVDGVVVLRKLGSGGGHRVQAFNNVHRRGLGLLADSFLVHGAMGCVGVGRFSVVDPILYTAEAEGYMYMCGILYVYVRYFVAYKQLRAACMDDLGLHMRCL